MTEYNASDRKDIKRATKAAKATDIARKGVVLNLMSSTAGREWMLNILELCHIFQTSFVPEGLTIAFLEGQRSIGLHHLNDIMQYCPDSYIKMMRERNERTIAAATGRAPDSGSTGEGPVATAETSGDESVERED